MHAAIYAPSIQSNVLVYSTCYEYKKADLPQSYASKIKSLPHVKDVIPCQMIFSYFNEPNHLLNAWGLDPNCNLRKHRDMGDVSDATFSLFANERMAGLVGISIMDRYGWKVEDKITIKSLVKGVEIPFIIKGIMYNDNAPLIYLNLSYVQDMMNNPGRLSWISVKAEDDAFMPEISQKIEAMFRNYPVEVTTVSEKSFMDSVVEQFEAVLIAFRIIGIIGIIAIFFLVTNNMAISMRERTAEIGVMRALGFTRRRIAELLLTESIWVAVFGGMLGSFVAYLIPKFFPISIPGAFRLLVVPDSSLLYYGLLISILIGFSSAFFPVLKSTRIGIADAVRSIE
jgi:putative ABC transport system permease protein